MTITLQEKQIEKIVERTVIRVLRVLLSDPDRGLKIRLDFEKRLKKSIVSRKAGKLKDFQEILASISL